ncbi:uncharacterized protein TAF1C-like isoform X2 [Halyomorpha halys]|uniref:uncharacterized protein TAF1C-like isoform X2 n=1 Tax=Halyomorpha halys TaxID=286706 RepID=UPI0006D522AF|nr:uncharacterized protein LOC106683278 isoform X2 [Halyomorpha halys]
MAAGFKNYNSYFNRTNITCLESGLDKFLIRPKTYGEGVIVISRLNLNENSWDIDDYSITSSTGIPGPIYEINTKNNIIVTRQKQDISLFSLEYEDNAHAVSKKLTVKKNCPFVSVCTNGSNFCTLSVKKELQIFDLAVGRQVFQEKLFNDAPMSDNWGSIFYTSDNTLSYLDRSSCGVIDLRMKSEVKKWNVKDFTEDCEEIYTGGIGINELQYVVTSHQVLSLDLRVGFSQRWTHCIGHSPAVMSLLSTSTKSDMLFIGSQKNDTVVLIENDRVGDQGCSKVQPYALPSLRETLHLAQYNGYCLGNTVQSRFNMSLTGLCCIESQDKITLFSTTSIGDVFKQTLKKNTEVSEFELNENELNKLENWEEQCEDLLLEMNEPCYVTDLLDDTKILKCIQDDKKLYEETFNKLEKCKSEWNVSKKELLSYCDYLAPKILEEWDIDVQEEWSEFPEKVLDELSSDEEDNVTDRVMKWIEKYSEEMNTNPIVDMGDTREEPRVQRDITMDTNSLAFEASEIDLKPDISSIEPSSSKNKMTSSTPRIKFISGF